jgi:hypothetical protein
LRCANASSPRLARGSFVFASRKPKSTDQYQGRAQFELIRPEILPVQVRQGRPFPFDAVRLINLQPREAQEPYQFGRLVQMAFDKAGSELCGISGHVDDDRRLERVVRKGTRPRCRRATGDGKAVPRAAEPVRARNEIVSGYRDAIREFEQAQQVVGINGMVASCLADAFRELTQIDARTACRPKPFAHSLEVVDRKRVRQRLVDQLRHGFAGIGQGHREILYQRLLSELRCRKRELDGNFFSRARFGRITA